MYKLINSSTGLEIGVTEQLRYIRKNPNSGAYIQCSANEAEGVSFNGRWNIFPFEKMDDADGQAVICEIDITDYIKQIAKARADLDFVAMMADVDIPVDEPERPELEEDK